MIMKLQSTQTNQPLSHSSSTDWQVLGELELPFGVDAGPAIKTWLLELLTPLRLHVDFLNRVLESAENAVARAVLFIYLPVTYPLDLQT
jgi:hypothetical protein